MIYLKDIPFASKVKCGDFYLASKEVESFCAKSVRKLLAKQIGDDRFFGEKGSVTLVKSGGRYLAVLTAHQLERPDFSKTQRNFSENFIIPSLRDKIKNLPVKSLKYCIDGEGEEYRDIVCYEMDLSDSDFCKERVYFYPLKSPSKSRIHYHFYVGCPRMTDNSVYSEDGSLLEIKNRVLIKPCVLNQSFKSEALYFRQFSHELNSIPVDGLSGGAIFVMIENEHGFEVCLDSIIVRGNKRLLHGISSEFITMM